MNESFLYLTKVVEWDFLHTSELASQTSLLFFSLPKEEIVKNRGKYNKIVLFNKASLLQSYKLGQLCILGIHCVAPVMLFCEHS